MLNTTGRQGEPWLVTILVGFGIGILLWLSVFFSPLLVSWP